MLAPKKKVTKKELKYDPLLDSIEKAQEFYEEHSKQITGGVVALVVVLVLAWGWMNSMESTRNEAMLASTKATIAAMGGIDDNVLAELESVVNRYGTNQAASQATYQLGVARIEAGDLDGAKTLFTGLASSSDPHLKTAGILKLAYLAEKASDYAEAALLYEQVGSSDDGTASQYAKLQAGYAYIADGNVIAADKIVKDLLDEKPAGKFLDQVKYLEGKVLEK